MKMELRPYRSVKEAVELYGKRILAPDLYTNVLEEMEGGWSEEENYLSKIKSVTIELEEAKQNLQKAKERSIAMERSLSSLQEELQQTKCKLQILKEISESEIFDDDDVPILDGVRKFDSKEEEEEGIELHGKRHVDSDGNSSSSAGGEILIRSNSISLNKKKKKKLANNKIKKPSMSLIGGIFSKKK